MKEFLKMILKAVIFIQIAIVLVIAIPMLYKILKEKIHDFISKKCDKRILSLLGNEHRHQKDEMEDTIDED